MLSAFKNLGKKKDSDSVPVAATTTTPTVQLQNAKRIQDVIKQGNMSTIFERLLEEGTPAISALDENKRTLLHIAAEAGHKDVVNLLLLHRLTEINAHDSSGWTPLHAAANTKHLKVCAALLQKGADPNALNVDSTPVLHYLVKVTWSEELREVLNLCLAHGADKEAKNNYGESPLQRATSSVNKEVVNFLLDNGCDVHSVNQFGETSLHKAARMLHAKEDQAKECIVVLLTRGANPYQRGVNGTALDVIQEPKLRGTMEELIKQHCKIPAPVSSSSLPSSGAMITITSASSAPASSDNPLALAANSGPIQLSASGNIAAALSGSTQSGGSTSHEQTSGSRLARLKAMNTGGSRIVNVPEDWQTRDSSQKAAYLLNQWQQKKLSAASLRHALKSVPPDGPTAARVGSQTNSGLSPPTATSMTASAESDASDLSSESPRELTDPEAVLESSKDPSADSIALSLSREFEKGSLARELSKELDKVNAEHAAAAASGPPLIQQKDGNEGTQKKEKYAYEKEKNKRVRGYRLELGGSVVAPSPRGIPIDMMPEIYKSSYMSAKHWNYVGYLSADGDTPSEPAVISIMQTKNNDFRALIRTHLGNIEASVPKLKSNPTSQELLCALAAHTFTGHPQFWEVEDPDIMFELIEYEKNDPQRTTCLPIGIIYAKQSDQTASDFWKSSAHPSPAFDQFLHLLGDKITLEGWSGYNGGLDTVLNKKGKYSFYTRWRGLEIMFHVSSLLPYAEWDENKLQISRVIGNDITNVIFHDAPPNAPADVAPPYNPDAIISAVTHVWSVVRPAEGNRYRVGFIAKSFVPAFAPEMPSELTREQFKDLFLTKLVNGHFAAQKSKGLARMYSRPREGLLQAIVEQFQESGKPIKLALGDKPRSRTMGEHLTDVLTRSNKRGNTRRKSDETEEGSDRDKIKRDDKDKQLKEDRNKKRESLSSKTTLALSGKYHGSGDNKIDN